MPKKEKTFEEALDRLQEIVSVLEDNEKPLDETVRLFEEGLQLVQLCDERLKKFETQIEELSEKHADESKAD
ncbi:MAG: exodeoxyribonuclease VII small subunit [Bulleidia sp.]